MAEIAGLALGAAGLATVFSGCIDAFDHVRVARTQDSALRILSTKLENQKVRFIIWGQSLGLDSAEGYNPQLDLPIRRDSIRRTMTLVSDLFMEGECLQHRYGLRKEPEQLPNAVVVFDPAVDQGVWKDFFKKIRVKVKKQRRQQQQKQQTQQQQQQQNQLKPVESQGSVVRWVIVDRNDFTALVTNLRELIDDLESMCKFADVHEYRRMRVTYEIESMGDTESLNLIRAASEDDDDDAMSIAASNRLDELEYYSTEEHGYAWGPHKRRPESNAYLVSYEPLSKPEEEAPRFYTPPSSVVQPHPRGRSRHRSKSPHDPMGGDVYWVPKVSSPEASSRYHYENTKYGSGAESPQSDAPTSPSPEPHYQGIRGRYGSTRQLNLLEGIVSGQIEHDPDNYHSPSDDNLDQRLLDILTKEKITLSDDDSAPSVVDSASLAASPSAYKMSRATRIDGSIRKATTPGPSGNLASAGAAAKTVQTPLRRTLGAHQPSQKATARPGKDMPDPVEAESYQQIIDHVRERRSHRRKPRGRFASILESDGEDDSSVDQVLLSSHTDKPVDFGPHAGQSAEEKPSEETISTNRDNSE